jgi:carbamoylphosphate synthase large subunit
MKSKVIGTELFMHVKVLLATSAQWISTARLAMALAETGCEVHALCRRAHPLKMTSVAIRTYQYSDLHALGSLERAIRLAKPDLVIACDEDTFRLVHEMYRGVLAAKDAELCELLERSLGRPENYETALSRFGLMELARGLGIGVPETVEVGAAPELRVAGERLGWPLVLKNDGSSGGNGVRVAENLAEATTFWGLLRGPASPLRTVHRVLVNKRMAPLYATVRRERRTVVAQRNIAGREATLAVACWKGKVLASHCMQVVETWSLRGPSSVLEVIESGEMLTAAQKLVKRLGLSGFCGFDFIVERVSGKALLIEMNSRPTQTCHLALGEGKDLVASLVRAIHRDLGYKDRPEWRPAVTDQDFVVLFPQELQRDRTSAWMRNGFHDVPTGEPHLIAFALAQRGQDWYSKVTRRVSRLRRQGP